jgi:outer membrane protein OmpA-like peptidoglycan-associated protein
MGQSLQQADELFENFEFSAAANLYVRSGSLDNYSQEQKDRLMYCLFIVNKAELGYSLADSLLRQGNPNKELWYYKAHFERELGKFDEAIRSAEKYLLLGGENMPLKFRESCYIHMNTPEYVEGELKNHELNDGKINSINYIGEVPVYFNEIGVDSLGNKIGLAKNKGVNAQMLLMRPFLENNGLMTEWTVVDEPGKELSINSIQFDTMSQKVYFAASMPGTVDPLLLVSHIYEADAASVGNAITAFRPWKYSGLEDSSSCAHVSLSTDGNTMVFSKLLKGRQDGDLYFSKRSNGEWSVPTLIPGINTLSQEVFPVISGDSMLYFSSDGHIGYGGLDLFSIPFTSDWSHDTLTRLPLPVNSTSDDFNYRPGSSEGEAIFVSNRRNGKGDDDIWKFQLPKPIVPEPVIEVKEPENPSFDLDAFLKYCNSKRIYFVFNQEVLVEKFDFVEKLNQLESEGYKFSIIVTGYADARGTVPANYQVGLRRAEAVKKDLIARGIEVNSIKCVSMGSTKIENRCKNAKIQCSEEEHRMNRYVQLTISSAE